MTVIDFNGPGFNYVVKYKHSTDSTWTKTVLDRIKEKFTIPNAETNQLWYFTLQANNSEGLGPMCLENSTHTGQSSKFMQLKTHTNFKIDNHKWILNFEFLYQCHASLKEFQEVKTINPRWCMITLKPNFLWKVCLFCFSVNFSNL